MIGRSQLLQQVISSTEGSSSQPQPMPQELEPLHQNTNTNNMGCLTHR